MHHGRRLAFDTMSGGDSDRTSWPKCRNFRTSTTFVAFPLDSRAGVVAMAGLGIYRPGKLLGFQLTIYVLHTLFLLPS